MTGSIRGAGDCLEEYVDADHPDKRQANVLHGRADESC